MVLKEILAESVHENVAKLNNDRVFTNMVLK